MNKFMYLFIVLNDFKNNLSAFSQFKNNDISFFKFEVLSNILLHCFHCILKFYFFYKYNKIILNMNKKNTSLLILCICIKIIL